MSDDVVQPVYDAAEERRLAALHRTGLLDSLREECFDRVVRLAAELCETPIALFSLVDRTRQWFKSSVGLDACETPRDVSFCARAVAANEVLTVGDAVGDVRFANNALVTGPPHIRFYCGVPVHDPSGEPLGTLCVIDRVPRLLEPQQEQLLGQLALEIEAHLRLRGANEAIEDLLLQREEMVAMVAHDSNNLVSVAMGELGLLQGELGDHEGFHRVKDALEGLARMNRDLVALRHTHAGQPVPQVVEFDIGAWLAAFGEREAGRAEREERSLEVVHSVHGRFATDQEWLERMLRNMLDNAFRHAPAQSTVRLIAQTSAAGLRLSVEDRGPGVPEQDRDVVFDVGFSRRRPGERRGRGLGLAFCRIAAEALGGRVWVEPREPSGAAFMIELPGTISERSVG